MPGDDLDLKFEKALAGHLRASHGEREGCFDAETLAAYQEGALPETQRLAAKEHIATCDRCQEIIALSGEPAERGQAVPWSAGQNANAAASVPSANPTIIRPRSVGVSQWRWLAPAGSIAALLILWVATRNQSPAPPIDVARNQPASAAPSPNQNLASNQTRAPNENRVDLSAGARKETEPAAKTRQSVTSSLPAAPAAKTSLGGDAIARANAPTSLPAPGSLTASGRAYAPVTAARSAMAPAAAADEAASNKIAETAASGASAGTIAGIPGLQKQKKDGASAVQIRSPLADVLWRVSDSGLIQRSTDAGKTWTVQPSGVVEDLLAGSAPSGAICWVVGRNATILRTTDAGQHWQKVRSPVGSEISGIFGTSDQQATVTIGSQIYRTTDGGQTWSVLPEGTNP
jgi:Photosynthesis system II assembly factor YCF48/Putative zinc-finger